MTAGAAGGNLPAPWLELRELVNAEKRILSPLVFQRASQIFLVHYAEKHQVLTNLTREYTREEFLLVVDDQGAASGTSTSSLYTFRDMVAKDPVFGRWFKEASLPDSGQALLAARWLCHLTGLRHRTVEIFIDPPHLSGHTLVQVRGMDKYEAPGAFDIPCAGHVSGVDLAEESLRKELAEELNLSFEDFSAMRPVTRYNSDTCSPGRESLNNEHRFLYRAALKKSAVEQIRFADGEVAGLAVFAVAELRALVEHFPERIASGLSDAMKYYI